VHEYRSNSNLVDVAEFLSVLIFLEDGVGTRIGFDKMSTASCKKQPPPFNDTCNQERPLVCTDSCELTESTQQQTCEEKGSEIKIFLGFVGQDADSVPLVSAQTMPSTFLKFGVGEAVTGATELFTDLVNQGMDFFT
jgi:hypothetical protein